MPETLDDRVRDYARANRLTIPEARNRLIALGLATATSADDNDQAFVETIGIGIGLAIATFEARHAQALASLKNLGNPTPPRPKRTASGRGQVVHLNAVAN